MSGGLAVCSCRRAASSASGPRQSATSRHFSPAPRDADERVQRASQPRLVERAGDPRVELHAPRRRLRVQQRDDARRGARLGRHPLAVELAGVVALAAAHDRQDVVDHPDEVVHERARHGVARAAPLALHERRRMVDVGLEVVVVDRDVQAVGGHVLAQRDHPGVVDPAGAAVAMEVAGGVEVRQQRRGVGDRRSAPARTWPSAPASSAASSRVCSVAVSSSAGTRKG